ncbi:unnamed protein product, partial [Mesorhabditis belari]|uniref:Ubiquitin-like domain-containing protein n=1 Tax=Mesorhabditis belari TaxID=2138241 RepID=A0AAF3ESS7_9BILA
MDPGGISLPPNGEDSVTITVKSPMGGPDLLFQLWKDAKVAELKTNVSEKIGVITEKFALMHKAIELKEDEWPIAQYGITDEKPITEKELRLYFPCAETEAELEIVRHDLYLAPQNMQQVNEVRAKFDLMARVRCKICSKKLQLREQEQKCACERAFCVKHRQPESHHCPVDFKNQGRVKIHKENPKICGGGAHKGKVE